MERLSAPEVEFQLVTEWLGPVDFEWVMRMAW